MTGAPAASLAGYGFRRAAPKHKDGDLTERLAESAAPPPAPPPQPTPDEPPPRAEEIVIYWERLRRGRSLPPLAELDRALVAKAWPGSLIVLFGGESAMPSVSRLGAADEAIEYTPMVTDWILTRARQAARRGARGDEVSSFPLRGESLRYRLFLLPLESGAGAPGVLCHLSRVA
jgi:hypothetical protein